MFPSQQEIAEFVNQNNQNRQLPKNHGKKALTKNFHVIIPQRSYAADNWVLDLKDIT